MIFLSTNQGISQSYDAAIGVTYEAAREDADEALHIIVERFGQLTDRSDVILVVGSDYTDVATGTELSFNAKIAANLGSPVVLVVHGRGRSPEQIRAAADSAIAELRANHAHTVAVIANRVDHDAADAIRAALADLPDIVTAAIEESPLLSAPTFRALVEAADAELVLGSQAWMDREALELIVGGDEPASRLGSAHSRCRSDRAERPYRSHSRVDARPSVGHVPPAGRNLAYRRIRDPRKHPAAVRGCAAGPADCDDRPWALSRRPSD